MDEPHRAHWQSISKPLAYISGVGWLPMWVMVLLYLVESDQQSLDHRRGTASTKTCAPNVGIAQPKLRRYASRT